MQQARLINTSISFIMHELLHMHQQNYFVEKYLLKIAPKIFDVIG